MILKILENAIALIYDSVQNAAIRKRKMEEAKKDAKLQKAIRTAKNVKDKIDKKIINDAKIEARKVALIMNVLPTPSPLIDAPTLVVTPIDMIDSNKSVTRKSSRGHVPNTQLIRNYDTSSY